MKRPLQFLVYIITAFLCSSCKVDSTENPDNSIPSEDRITFIEGTNLNPILSEIGSELYYTFSTTNNWSATLSSDTPTVINWIDISPKTGTAGVATITVSVQPNETYENRIGRICLQCGNDSQTIIITQVQKDALVVAPESYTLDNSGGDIEIEINHNIDFDIEITDDWISPITTRALKTEILAFHIAENSGYENREGQIIFTSKDQTLTQTIKIYQAQKDALIISQTDYVFDETAQNFSVEVRSNIDFLVENPDVDWLHPIETRSLSSHTLNYLIDENSSYDYRSTEIKIIDLSTNKSQTISITQMQKDALVVAPESYTLDNSGGDIEIEINHNIDFDIEINVNWISYVKTRGLTTDNLIFHIEENPNHTDREGLISFQSLKKDLYQEVKITQEGSAKQDEAKIRELLVQLYNDTNGDNWTRNDNWCSDEPLNTWFGVSYSKSGELRLSFVLDDFGNVGNNLSGKIDLSGCDALTELVCGHNQLTSINISNCKSITKLICKTSQIADLDITGCSKLSYIDCEHNQLTNTNFSELPALCELYCGDNKLTSITTTGNKNLKTLRCYINQPLQSVNISDCSSLTYLNCDRTSIQTLDVSNSPELKYLNCSQSQLSKLNISNCYKLEEIYCNNNHIEGLMDISERPNLNEINLSHNPLTAINLSNCISLRDFEYFSSETTKLTSLNLSGCTNLQKLECSNQWLNTLNVSGCTQIEDISCTNNQLKELNLLDCKNLKFISCNKNQINTLNLACPETLYQLDCSDNYLTDINISGYMIAGLYCSNNPLTTLNFSNCPRIGYIKCNGCNLTTLDVPESPNLYQLNCSNCELTYLDISKCPKLNILQCANNKLKELDFSTVANPELLKVDWSHNPFEYLNLGDVRHFPDYTGNVRAGGIIYLKESLSTSTQLKIISNKIEEINIESNQLQSIDVSECPALKIFNCENNPLTELVIEGCRQLENLRCYHTLICREIPEWFKQLSNFAHYPRYEYYESSTGKIEYTDNKIGWWYPGEPEKGYHGW